MDFDADVICEGCVPDDHAPLFVRPADFMQAMLTIRNAHGDEAMASFDSMIAELGITIANPEGDDD